MPRVTGRVLDIDLGEQTVPNEHGEPSVITTTTLHVLDGREVVRVKLARQYPDPFPNVGDDVDLRVGLYAWLGRNRDAQISVVAQKEWADAFAPAHSSKAA